MIECSKDNFKLGNWLLKLFLPMGSTFLITYSSESIVANAIINQNYITNILLHYFFIKMLIILQCFSVLPLLLFLITLNIIPIIILSLY